MKLKSMGKKLVCYVVIPTFVTVIAILVTAGMVPVGALAYNNWRGWPVAWWHFQAYEVMYPWPVLANMIFNLAGLVADIVIFYGLVAGVIYLYQRLS